MKRTGYADGTLRFYGLCRRLRDRVLFGRGDTLTFLPIQTLLYQSWVI